MAVTRRGLFGVLAGLVAAPIVVRSGLLMPVRTPLTPFTDGMVSGVGYWDLSPGCKRWARLVWEAQRESAYFYNFGGTPSAPSDLRFAA